MAKDLPDLAPAGAIFDLLRWDADGLVPAIAQDARTREVLMLAWANREALRHTLATRRATWYSRSRRALWIKGETSGHAQQVVEVRADCDGDCLLYLVDPAGPACHTNRRSCFSWRVGGDGAIICDRAPEAASPPINSAPAAP